MEYLLGVLTSLIVEAVKRFWGTDSFTTHVALFAVAFIGAALYVWFQTFADLWPSFIQTAVVASAFHNLILRKF